MNAPSRSVLTGELVFVETEEPMLRDRLSIRVRIAKLLTSRPADLDADRVRRRRAQFNSALVVGVLFLSLMLTGCHDLVPRNTKSLLLPRFQRSEIVGFLAGLGTTFAAFPDLIAMLKRRSSEGMNPRMAAIMGVFQILWIYYGLLILSRPVVLWNVIAVLVNFLSVGVCLRFAKRKPMTS